MQLTAERKGMEMVGKSLAKCETLLKKFIDKNDELKGENVELHEQVCIQPRTRFLLLVTELIHIVLFLAGKGESRADGNPKTRINSES